MFWKFSSQSEFVMYTVPTEHDATFVLALGLFKFGGLLDTEVEQSTKVCVDTGTFEFLLGLALGVPAVAD